MDLGQFRGWTFVQKSARKAWFGRSSMHLTRSNHSKVDRTVGRGLVISPVSAVVEMIWCFQIAFFFIKFLIAAPLFLSLGVCFFVFLKEVDINDLFSSFKMDQIEICKSMFMFVRKS